MYKVIDTISEETRFDSLIEALAFAKKEAEEVNWKVPEAIYVLNRNKIFVEIANHNHDVVFSVFDFILEGNYPLDRYKLVRYKGADGFTVGTYLNKEVAIEEAKEIAKSCDFVEVIDLTKSTWDKKGSIPNFFVEEVIGGRK